MVDAHCVHGASNHGSRSEIRKQFEPAELVGLAASQDPDMLHAADMRHADP